ncbi:hypothetical protein REPUB_Repub17cG0052900 [Reevesia pubescens]
MNDQVGVDKVGNEDENDGYHQWSVPVQYMSGSEDGELVEARIKFKSVAKKGQKSRTNGVDEGINIGVNVVRDGMAKGKQKVSERVQSEKEDYDDGVKNDY